MELFDKDGKKTVSFRVGKSYKSKGNYLYNENKKDIYLSQSKLWLNSSYKDFINTVLLEVKKEDVDKVTLKTDKELEVTSENKKFNEYVANLSNLKFEDFLTITDPKAQGLQFSKEIQVELKNKLIYKISLAQESKEHFVKLRALLDEAPKQFVVRQQDGKEELQKIEDVIRAQGDAQKLNNEKAAWVYKVNKSTYEKLVKDSKFFL